MPNHMTIDQELDSVFAQVDQVSRMVHIHFKDPEVNFDQLVYHVEDLGTALVSLATAVKAIATKQKLLSEELG
jgi:hypothetical protein